MEAGHHPRRTAPHPAREAIHLGGLPIYRGQFHSSLLRREGLLREPALAGLLRAEDDRNRRIPPARTLRREQAAAAALQPSTGLDRERDSQGTQLAALLSPPATRLP